MQNFSLMNQNLNSYLSDEDMQANQQNLENSEMVIVYLF